MTTFECQKSSFDRNVVQTWKASGQTDVGKMIPIQGLNQKVCISDVTTGVEKRSLSQEYGVKQPKFCKQLYVGVGKQDTYVDCKFSLQIQWMNALVTK